MKYKIIKPLNSGAFGTVYEIETDDNMRYALKEVKNLNITNKQRFEREIKILSQLNHPNVVKILQWNMGGEAPNFTPYYIMEYLGGGSLRQHMDEKFSSDERYVFERKWTINRIILPTCNALAQAHSSNIFHRDLKPDNIMYTDPNKAEIKITDWGLGKDINRESLALTAAAGGEIGGTPGYCSPEQWFAFDDLIDGRTDIFSLGIIFYEMMTRIRPPSYDNKMNRPLVDPPSKYHSTISRKLDRCIMKMIDLKPENRQQSIWDLIFDVETLPDNYS
ncbi:MAG TPA: serine/threonine-protein kinase [Candidatus Acidoferrum sp.]|nr:serine/threonine-protein kinase [Candidatus Acidoferrum sp.]